MHTQSVLFAPIAQLFSINNIVQSFANSGMSLILDDERIIRCQITPHMTRWVIGMSLVPGVSGSASDELEEGKEHPNVGSFGRIADLLFPVD
jgi:hypothetical protein